MIENRQFVSGGFEPIQAHGAEVSWAAGDSSFEQVEFGSKRILVADDEELLRACLRMMLELEGHQVTEARNGAEALDLFKSGEFDLVITDFEMPVMQGDELAVSIKLLSPSLPVLMVTGSGRARPDARNPVDAVLSKPFNVGELHDALGKLFSAQRECAKSAH
jgi:CheY-like chemotaxis protein